MIDLGLNQNKIKEIKQYNHKNENNYGKFWRNACFE